MFFPKLDGDFVDVSGRRKDGRGGSGRGRRRSGAGLLTLGWWCSGCTARASCLSSSFAGRHFLKEGVWSCMLLFVYQQGTINVGRRSIDIPVHVQG